VADPAHEVCVPCDCGNIEACRLELYVSDVRIAYAEMQHMGKVFADVLRNVTVILNVLGGQEAERDDRHGLARA
jgi:hypothetical protein